VGEVGSLWPVEVAAVAIVVWLLAWAAEADASVVVVVVGGAPSVAGTAASVLLSPVVVVVVVVAVLVVLEVLEVLALSRVVGSTVAAAVSTCCA
jgi:hypothetical protein